MLFSLAPNLIQKARMRVKLLLAALRVALEVKDLAHAAPKLKIAVFIFAPEKRGATHWHLGATLVELGSLCLAGRLLLLPNIYPPVLHLANQDLATHMQITALRNI